MLGFLIYLTAVLAELLFFMSFSVYVISLIYSHLKGAPYVPTTRKEVDFIIRSYKMKRGDKFLDLGCGDGRVSQKAAQIYKVRALGIDVNPLLICWAKIQVKRKKIKNVEFIVENIFNIKLTPFDIIYIFLMPELIKKIIPKLERELKKTTIVISHGFKIDGYDNYLFKTINHKPFPTYFYRFRPD